MSAKTPVSKKKTAKTNSLFGKIFEEFTHKNVKAAPKVLYKKTVQDSIPIYAVHEQYNLIETYPGLFTRSYWIKENNYQSETEDREEEMYIDYRKVLNSLGTNEEYALTIMNRNVDMREIEENVLCKETGDELDYLRREMNDITLDRIRQGRNGLEKLKYITIGLHCDDLKKASNVFNKSIDRRMSDRFKKLESDAIPIPIEKKLEILHDIYNPDDQGTFLTHKKIQNPKTGIIEDISEFDLENMRSQGCTVKDIIGPPSFAIHDSYIEMGSKYVRTMRVINLPATMGDDFFCKLTDVEFNILTTVNIRPIPAVEAHKIVSKNLGLARSEMAEQRKALIKSNLPEEMVSDDTRDNVERAEELRDEMNKNDERLFKTCYTITFWADSLEELNDHTETIVTTCQTEGVGIQTMTKMQEEGFNYNLPLCDNELPYSFLRTLKSSSAAIFFPFSNLELMDKGGINYSCNLYSKNLIVYDRTQTQNFNGFVLGKPGCFVGETKVMVCRDGNIHDTYEMTLKEMEASDRSTFDIVTYDRDEWHFKAAHGVNARITKYTQDVVTVELTNGDELTCTPDHLFMDYHGDYVEAARLQRGLQLMSFSDEEIYVRDVTPKTLALPVPVYDIEERDLEAHMTDRENFALGCGVIVHNSGKSFTSKVEMLSVMLKSNSDCIVIDPEGEYGALTRLIHGQEIKIEPGGKWHINPLEIDSGYEWESDEENASESNPVYAKCTFIIRLIETMLDSPLGISAVQKTVVDESVRELYKPWMRDDGGLNPIPKEKMPTLADLQRQFAMQAKKVPEARELEYCLKLYTEGSLNAFAYQSNVDIHNRFITYNIRDVGEELMPLAMMIILDSLFNTMFRNKKSGKYTWIWIDEIYLMFRSEKSAATLNELFKRSRKHGGIPTGITQNVEDLLESNTARKMLSNCNFVQILNQSTSDRDHLRELLNLSQSQADVITSAPKGQGLIYTGDTCVPFFSVFPKGNSIYRCLTSNMKEIREYEEEERRKRIHEQKFEKKRSLINSQS